MATIYYTGDFGSMMLTGGNDVVLAFTPVPEPASVLLISALGAGLGGLAYRRWRKPAVQAA
jgi:hypothetical protein